MISGVIWALAAGLMLGLYALPEKFTKDFAFENTWGAFFLMALFIVPPLACFSFINGFGRVLGAIPGGVLLRMGMASILWGIGMLMWGKAINHLGLSLGFSIFIGTIILVGSLLPFFVDGVPGVAVLLPILLGLLIVLAGVAANGRAGMLRQADESAEAATGQGRDGNESSGSTVMGIFIAVTGGLLATGFSFANAVGHPNDPAGQYIQAALVEQGNPAWMVALAIMFIIYVAGGLFVVPWFIFSLSRKRLWGNFKTPRLGRNLLLAACMAGLNFAASATFAYAAFLLGDTGGTVGYAIFNTVSVAVATVCGLLVGEWAMASRRATKFLFAGLASMIIGILVVAFGPTM